MRLFVFAVIAGDTIEPAVIPAESEAEAKAVLIDLCAARYKVPANFSPAFQVPDELIKACC